MKVSLPKAKQDYSSPKLLTYGNLSELTKSTGNMGSNDGPGTGKNHKTL